MSDEKWPQRERPPRRINLRYVQRAFPIRPFRVICPTCSEETNLPRAPRVINQDGDWVFRCKACQQQFLYNPFVDKAKEEEKPIGPRPYDEMVKTFESLPPEWQEL